MKNTPEESKICMTCLACCKEINFPAPLHPNVKEFYEARGLEITELEDAYLISVPHTCQHLHPVFGCKIYPTRPAACRHYDGRRDPTMQDKCKLIKKGDIKSYGN